MDSWLAVVTDRTRMGTRVDLLFRANFVELGVSENGKISDVLCKRSLEELSVKCPKTLKNMLLRLARRAPVAASKLLSDLAAGLFINLLTMDCPRGYVCRVSRLPDWLQYPVSEVEFVKFIIPIIQLIWYAKKMHGSGSGHYHHGRQYTSTQLHSTAGEDLHSSTFLGITV